MVKKVNSDRPDPPKRPLSAFFLYKGDVYEQTKKENPDLKITELTKLISEKWNAIDANTKTKYEKKTAEAKQKYEKELQDYVDKYGEVDKKKRSKKGNGYEDSGRGKKSKKY